MNNDLLIIEAYKRGYIAGALSVEEDREDVCVSMETIKELIGAKEGKAENE